MDEPDPIVAEFLSESQEILDTLDQCLVAIERDPTDRDLLDQIFRTMHTIKGTAGCLGFEQLERISHRGENLLSQVREGQRPFDSEIADALLGTADAVRVLLDQIADTGQEGDTDFGDLVEQLESMCEAPAGGAKKRTRKRSAGRAAEGAAAADSEAKEAPDAPADAVASAPAQPAPGRAAQTARSAEARPAGKGSAASDMSIRVSVALLDSLMTLMGELVLTRNHILKYSEGSGDVTLTGICQRLNHLTSEMQEHVMKTRMQPVGSIWSRFPRVVRDLAQELGKDIRLHMEGENTELDRSLIEAIKDPLTHLVRNSCDHGIETPEIRVQNGKPATGRVDLRAYHECGQVNIEVSDDGAGLDLEKIRAKALSLGLITHEQIAQMAEHDQANLIFIPGLSTADKVSNVSGRGVGMDVVRSQIERIGGAVDASTERGVGSCFKMKIPLTLAIIPALIVRDHGVRFAIPQASLRELVRVGKRAEEGRIEMMHGAPVYRLRGRLLPIVSLCEALRLGEPPDPAEPAHIVVLQADKREFGLRVEGIDDTQEIVVRPFGPELADLDAFAGATIMGDGQVALILDVMSIAQRASVISEGRGSGGEMQEDALAQEERTTRDALLVVGSPDGGRAGIPLSAVERLERFPAHAIERLGEREVVQYRGRLMHLTRLEELLEERRERPRRDEPAPPGSSTSVVVYTTPEGEAGLVVRGIYDIVEAEVAALQPPSRASVLGSLVLQGRATEVIDIRGLNSSATCAWSEST